MKHHKGGDEDEEDVKEKSKNEDKQISGKKRKRGTSDLSDAPKPEKRKRVNSTISAKSDRSEGPVTRSMDNASAAATEASKPGKQVLFKRIDESKFQNIQTHFQDNSFEAKARFGQGGDSYGAWSNSKLHDKHGKNFIKEKNKMKKRNSHASGGFQAGAVNSTKLY